ncbi:response regulator [Propioniciclava tarda]|uniref:Response regulator transcription factor n=1 Tax=Propioniciclava tarda TaxID=433330 RepID=A0A4Q9KJI2_PROTD|nr:response regulator transcription factor [Propioniciclava tarda]TBT94612.1 response regulator transcription factor [Propioniciclava tarda]SMO66539.1 DNA-binding response regulator, NarL/FixJ family, contains REC and HTH domains [Propioniciclava tarda]HOA88314.1 response regulator transcription factor [Propioniciclava tarda]HQA30322.1 response regulator transcription factor [Propioniciclava tarda]HQD60667.1 response regulator transcription factor [Propioniciclava tarda]
MDSSQIRIVIVDDDALVRTGLGLILGGSPDLAVVGEAADGVQGVAVVAELKPDVVLMDIRMPNKDGLTATADILAKPDAPKIIVLTTFDSDDMVLKALQAGASGFLLKDTPPAKMVDAIRAVDAGETTLSPSVISQVVAVATRSAGDGRVERALADLAGLTEREREVAVLIGQGLANAEIGKQLFMSIATVKSYVTRIFYKLGVDNRVQVAMKVHDAGLV